MDSIIFDVDGTLWDSADSVAAAWNLAIKKFSSLDITLDREILGSVFGKTMTDIGDILFPSLSETEKDSLLSACCELENNYLKNHPGIIYEGVADTIEKLSKKYPLFIVSNCQCGYIEATMQAIGIEHFIKDHLCFGETGVSKGQTLRMLIDRNHLVISCLCRRYKAMQTPATLQVFRLFLPNTDSEMFLMQNDHSNFPDLLNL